MAVVHVGGNPMLFTYDSSGRTGSTTGSGKQGAGGFPGIVGGSFSGSNSLVGGAVNGNGKHQQGDDWLREALPGEPGVDYPIYSFPVPETSFDCSDKV